MKKVFVFAAVVLAGISLVYAQPSVGKLKKNIDNEGVQQPQGLSVKLINSTQAAVRFGRNRSAINLNQVIPWLGQRLALRQNEDMLLDENRDVIIPGNIAVKKIHQYYRGIKLEHGVINVTSKNGQMMLMQLEFYSVPDGFDTRPAISEEAALEKAMAYANAQVYAWQLGDTLDQDRQKPVGELVIINNYESDSGKICLAYKFNIYGLQPLYRAFVYVNAHTGKVVLEDMIIKHAKARNSPGKNPLPLPATAPLHNLAPPVNFNEPINNAAATADTRFNGRRPILADLYSGSNAKPYRLRAIRNNHSIIVLNYEKNDYTSLIVPSYESTAPDFTDNNNDWTSAEYNNSDMDNGALDVMDNMLWVSDYWKAIHNRNSWNNSNGSVISYVHVYDYNKPYDNALWTGTHMLFGDGNGATGTDFAPVQTSLDDCAHELAHGVTSTTAGLVYRWESGALNESLSDIWAACITNYAKQSAGFNTELPWRLFEKTTNPLKPVPGGRDMQNPIMAPFKDPSTYHSLYWRAGDRVACPVPSQTAGSNNDMCGVHHNSGVLNKWFYLITAGETGTNSKGKNYSITGLGFAKSEKITYLMELNLTPNASYTTAMTVSLEAAFSLYGYGSAEYSTVKAAWAAVGVDTASVFNMANTPVFTTNNFTCVVPGGGGFVFAGTNYGGFYQYDGNDWIKRPELTDVRINDLKCDIKNNWIWIAQSGQLGQSGGGSSLAGGVNVLKKPYVGEVPLFYTVSPNPEVPSRNARCMYVDNRRFAEGVVPKVWVATLAYITSGNSISGMLGQGLYSTYKQFTPVSEGMNLAAGTVGCLTVGGNRNEVWTFVQANYGVNQLLVYNAQTNTLITTYDHNSVPLIPSGFVARAIYGDAFNRMWIGLANGGMLVFDEKRQWHLINFSNIFPSGSSVTFNAITGNAHGDIYVGTNFGLVFYDAGGGWASRIDLPEYYRLYGKANGLMSNNINAVAYDTAQFKLWVATDSGLIKWDPPCIGRVNCVSTPGTKNAFSASAKKGNWSDTATWASGIVPDSNTVVFITDSITVDINGQCNTISVVKPGNVTVNTGKSLKVYSTPEPIYNRQRQRQMRRR